MSHQTAPRSHRRVVVLIQLGLCLLAPVVPAVAQQGWGPVSTLTAPAATYPRSDRAVQVAANAAGDVVAAWGQGVEVRAVRFSSAAGHWTPAVGVGVTNSTGFGGGLLDVALDSAGNAVVVWSAANGIDAARYSAATSTWAAPVRLWSATFPSEPSVATDASGNAIVVWGDSGRIKTVRYSRVSDTWGVAEDISSGYLPRIAMDAAGNAIVMSAGGNLPAGAVRAMRYSVASGTWGSAIELVNGVTQLDNAPHLAIDAAGNAVAAWVAYTTASPALVQAARFTAATDLWSGVITLDGPAQRFVDVAVGATGEAVVSWSSADGRARASRYSLGSGTWNPAKDISAVGAGAELRHSGVDANGHAMAIWTAADRRVYAARNDAPSDTWSTPAPISAAGLFVLHTQIAVHPSGAATLVWGASLPGCPPSCDGAVQSSRWEPAPLAPAVTAVTAASGTLTVSFAAPPTADPTLAPTSYAYSLDGGATWSTRSPASPASPLVISGLTDFAPYSLALRAINSGGAGLPTSPLVAKAGSGSHAPTGLATTTLAGNILTIEWVPPDVGLVPDQYVLEGGVHPQEVRASVPTVSAVSRFTFAAPTGAFYLRVHGMSGQIRGPDSNEIRIFVHVPAPPSAPAALLGLVNGSSLALSWRNTLGGGPPTRVLLNVSGAVDATVPLPFGDTFTFAGVPPGTYTLRLIAANASGVSPPSNAVTLTFPGACSGAPDAPVNLQAWRIGSTIFVAWSPPQSGSAVESFVVSVAGAYVGSVAVTGRALSGTVPPGTYAFSVAATNRCGTGPATATQTVVVP